MALITIAVYDTEENKRSELTDKTLLGICDTVDKSRHRLIIVDNNSCKKTKEIIARRAYIFNECYANSAEVVTLNENVGTAKAINLGWLRRKPGEHCVKMDNDVVIHQKGWADELEEAITRYPEIGIIGLKRKDLIECTTHENPDWRSELYQLPHKPGERWIQIEKVRGVMGTCKMINAALIDKIGYLYQPTVYGFDDSLYSCRSNLAGFINCFLPHINIDHIDPGGTEYTEWKQKHAGETLEAAQRLVSEYMNGIRPIFEYA